MESARPDIGRQWIKANVIGGAINVALTFSAFIVGRVVGVSDPESLFLVQAVFVAVATAALTFGLVILGYLSGVVLRTRLPAFPMRHWLALYAITGVVFGAVSALAWLTVDVPDPDPLGGDVVAALALGAIIAGVTISTAFGSLQALVLRPVAQGLRLWIGCCALAGASFVLMVPAVVYGPQSGFAGEFAMELVTFVVTILAAFILLPAVHRMRPR